MFSLTFSRRLALIAGIALPALETARRWHEIPGPVWTWMTWLDDYLLGAILLMAAWKTASNARSAAGAARTAAWLAAAWGVACGFGIMSLFGQLREWLDPLRGGQPDPSGMPHEWVVAIKSFMLLLAVAALFAACRADTSAHMPSPPR